MRHADRHVGIGDTANRNDTPVRSAQPWHRNNGNTPKPCERRRVHAYGI